MAVRTLSDNRPISEQYRTAADIWVDADSAAAILEETKSAYFSELVALQGDIPVNRAEHNVKSSPTWKNYITKTVNARTAANKAKVQVEYLKMRFQEWQSAEANQRQELRMT